MASFSKVRAGLLGICVVVLSGCGEDPQLLTLQQRLLDLKKELAQTSANHTQASAESDALRAELSVLKTAQSAVDTSVREELKLALEALEATRGQLETAPSELAASSNALGAAEQQLVTLRAQVSQATIRAEALAGHLGLEEAQDTALADLMARLAEAYGAAMQDARTAAQQETATIKTLTAYIKRLKAADAAQQRMARQLQQVAQMRDAMRDGWQAERARAGDAARTSELTIANLRSQLETQDQTKESLAARADLLEVQRDDHAARLANKSAQLEAGLARLPALEAALANANSMNDDLLVTQDMQQRELQRMSEAEDFLYQLFERKSLDLRDTSSALKAAKSESGELAAALADVAAERDALKTEHAAVLAEREALQAEVAALDYEMAELTSALTTEEVAYDKVNQRAREAAVAAASLRQQLASTRAQAGKQIEFVTAELHAALAKLEASATHSTTGAAPAVVDAEVLAKTRARAEEAETLLAPMTAQRNELLSMLTAANARIAELETKLKP